MGDCGSITAKKAVTMVHDVFRVKTVCRSSASSGPDFAGGGPGTDIEDGSSLIIPWSSGSHKRSTNWANQL